MNKKNNNKIATTAISDRIDSNREKNNITRSRTMGYIEN